jgi:hypothetical protein
MSNEEKDRRRTKEGCIGELPLRARMELIVLSAPTQPGVFSILPDRDCDTVIHDSSYILRVQIVLSLTPLSGVAFSGGVLFTLQGGRLPTVHALVQPPSIVFADSSQPQ